MVNLKITEHCFSLLVFSAHIVTGDNMFFFPYFDLVVFAALIWQLMRAYTLSILTQLAESGNPIVEAEIITWVNSKLSEAKKSSSIRSFQDSSLQNALAVIDLVDAIKPGTINYDVVKMTGEEEVSCREVMGSTYRIRVIMASYTRF